MATTKLQTVGRAGWMYWFAAFATGLVLATAETIGCLFSPVGCGDSAWSFAALRLLAAALFGAWAGVRAFRGGLAAAAFLTFEGPFALSQGVLASISVVFTPRDPTTWPFFGLIVGLHLADLVAWATTWCAVSRRRQRRAAIP